jgi:DNA-directed RNA polymerase specialized sigma24 family protein
MPASSSSPASPDANAFPSCLVTPQRLRTFRRFACTHATMGWARLLGLGDDLEQLAVLEAISIAKTHRAERGTTVEQYVAVAMRQRMYSVYGKLARAYYDKRAPDARGYADGDARSEFVGDGQQEAESDNATQDAGGWSPRPERSNGGYDEALLPDLMDYELGWMYAGSRQLVADPALLCEQRRRVELLADQVARLPERQRQAVELTLTGSTEREIADAMGITVQAVRKSVGKALSRLVPAETESASYQ